jgi:hypothetical protein
LKPVLVQGAWGAARAKGTYYQAQFFRLKARRGPKKAAIAVAASLLTAAYHMLSIPQTPPTVESESGTTENDPLSSIRLNALFRVREERLHEESFAVKGEYAQSGSDVENSGSVCNKKITLKHTMKVKTATLCDKPHGRPLEWRNMISEVGTVACVP